MECRVESAGAVLAGTLCLPSGTDRVPCVLMLPGSGPLDRDENYKTQRLNIFNTIAHRLANKGFASLRYDKRGCGKSAGNYFKTGYFDFVADATAWFEWLEGHDRCAKDQLYALGHSEGTLTAMHLSLVCPGLAGVIQLCPTFEPAESTLLKQAQHVECAVRELSGLRGVAYRRLLRNAVARQRRRIDRAKSGQIRSREVKSLHIGLKWFGEILQLEPRQIYAQMRCPMLLVAGAKDVQCDPSGMQSTLNFIPAQVESHIVPNLTHVLRFDEHEPSVFSYAKLIKRPMEAEVLEMISRWLARQTACVNWALNSPGGQKAKRLEVIDFINSGGVRRDEGPIAGG